MKIGRYNQTIYIRKMLFDGRRKWIKVGTIEYTLNNRRAEKEFPSIKWEEGIDWYNLLRDNRVLD